MEQIHKERLTSVVKALRDSPDPERFNMDRLTHPCGAPACALGHYAARDDLQEMFVLVPQEHWYPGSGLRLKAAPTKQVSYTSRVVREHFGLTPAETHELFSASGCGEAKSADQAAMYIERFVARKEAQG